MSFSSNPVLDIDQESNRTELIVSRFNMICALFFFALYKFRGVGSWIVVRRGRRWRRRWAWSWGGGGERGRRKGRRWAICWGPCSPLTTTSPTRWSSTSLWPSSSPATRPPPPSWPSPSSSSPRPRSPWPSSRYIRSSNPRSLPNPYHVITIYDRFDWSLDLAPCSRVDLVNNTKSNYHVIALGANLPRHRYLYQEPFIFGRRGWVDKD